MYIIDKNKDYYDYYSHIYGVDKKIVFDRRGSTKTTDSDIFAITREFAYSYRFRDKEHHLLLEVGYIQYLISMTDIKFKKNSLNEEFESCKMKVVHKFEHHKHYFKTPISIREVDVHREWYWKRKKRDSPYIITDNFKETITKIYERSIENLILADTQLTTLFNPEDIWKEIQNYISSLDNDKDCSTKMTDVEKAEIHGFDKKTSFRNPIK